MKSLSIAIAIATLAAPMPDARAADLASAAEVRSATYDNMPTNRTFDFTATVAMSHIQGSMPVVDDSASTRIHLRGEALQQADRLQAGARGAMMKNAELDELVEAIKKVAAGEKFIDAEISQMLSEEPPIPALSPRQLQILQSVTRGLSNEEIAKMLGIGLSVEKEHLRATFAKIGAANRTEAVAIALRKQLVKT
ncbi:MAG: response regulator transcription factor [Kiritimatiellae bacterium]|nr:response regulator transcription factor [Kiritimatiellia bacterium]